MAQREPSSARLVFTLAFAGVLSGLLLVTVYLWAQPQIERNRAEALAAAIFRVLPGTTRSAPFVPDGDGLAPYAGPEGSVPKGEAVYAGYAADGTLVGYAIPAAGPGYMDTITLLYGIEPQRRTIVGMEVLDSRETPGLGDKILTDGEFLANFAALAVDPRIEPVKKGRKTRANEVDCITGATISSESVVAILNVSTMRWLPLLEAATTEAGDARSVE